MSESLSCLQLFVNTMGISPPVSSVHGILQARTLEWLLFPSPGDLPDPGIKPGSSVLQADFLPSEPPEKPSLKVVSSPSWWGCNEPQNWSIYPTNSIPHWLKFAPGGLKLQHFQVALYAEASSRGLGESFHAGRGRYLK